MSRILLRLALAAMIVPPGTAAPPAEVIGTGPLFHIVGDIDRSVAFYRGLLGVPAENARPQTFTADPELQQLYHLPGGRESAAIVRVPGSGLSLEFVEWRDVDRTVVQPRLQDPGASLLILTVRDILAMRGWLMKNGATILTPGGQPAEVEQGEMRSHALFARDPDGFFIEVVQPDVDGDTITEPSRNVTAATFAITVDNTERALRFYRDALGFQPESPKSFDSDKRWTKAAGLGGAQHRTSTAMIPGSAIRMAFIEFRNIDRKPLRSRIQDPGTSMLQLSVRDIAATVKALTDSGATVVTAGGGSTLRRSNPISLLAGIDGFFLEPMQPASLR